MGTCGCYQIMMQRSEAQWANRNLVKKLGETEIERGKEKERKREREEERVRE